MRAIVSAVAVAVLALMASAHVAEARHQVEYTCAPQGYSEACLSVPALTNGHFLRFHAGVLAAVFFALGGLFAYRLVYNFRVVPWRQSSVFLTCLISCIFHIVWLTRDAKNIQHPRKGLPFEGLADLTFTIVVCCLFGYMMKLDNEIRQNRVHWRIIVQWIMLCTAAILQLVKISSARSGHVQTNIWVSFAAYMLVAVASADRCLLLMKLLPATQRSSHTWFRKVNFITFFISACTFVNAAITFAHAIDEEVGGAFVSLCATVTDDDDNSSSSSNNNN